MCFVNRGGVRGVFLGLLFAGAILASWNLAVSPAQAAWSGWQSSHPTVEAACEDLREFRDAEHAHVVQIEPKYDSQGRISQYDCHIAFDNLLLYYRDTTYPSCPAGYEVNGNNASGCQLSVPPRALGKCDRGCGKNQLEALGDPGAGPTAGNPISVATGNKFEAVTDYRSGGTHAFTFTRSYNSQSKHSGALGRAWRHNFERRLVFVSGSRTDYHAADGRVFVFNKVGSAWQPASDVVLRLTNTDGVWTLTDAGDRIESFNSSGRLASIREKDGYQQILEYHSVNPTPSMVRDSHGRRLLFTYSADGLLQTITDGDGRKYVYRYRKIYDYPAQPRTLLHEVLLPDDTPLDQGDNPRIQYLYEDAMFPVALTGIIDEAGSRYASWSYDAEGRAISSEHAGTTDLYTIAYDPSGTRTVTNPLAQQTVYDFTIINGLPRVSQIERLAGPDIAAATASLSYDTNGFLASTTDWSGNVASYSYDSRGLLTSRTESVGEPEERTVATTWHTVFRVPTQIVAPRQTIDLSYDSDGLLASRTVTDTTSHALPYPTNGQSRTWTYDYSAGGEAPGGPAPLPTVPLALVNGDAETGDIGGWISTEGAFTSRSDASSQSPGDYYFYGGEDVPHSLMHQDVAVPAANLAEVDSGERAVRVAWKHNTYQGRAHGTIIVYFLDAADQTIGEPVEYLRSSAATWSARSIAIDVPPLTRKIRLELRAIRFDTIGNHSYFDDFTMALEARDPIRIPLAVQNADAEAGDLSGWVSEAGDFHVYFQTPWPAQGDYYFHPWMAAESRLSQDVPFPADQFDAIDEGGREFEVTWRQHSLEEQDAGSLEIRFFDGANGQVGPMVASPLVAPTWWQGQQLVDIVPPGARSVRITLRSLRGSGTTNNAYFDYVFANLIKADVPQLPLPRQLVSIDGPRSDVTDTTAFAYDDFGELTTIANALAHISSITERDVDGLPLTLVDENGIETALSYDARLRLIESRVKGGTGDAVTAYGYDDTGLLTEVTLPDGSSLAYEYDAAQRLTAIANDLGERIEYTLDSMGNRTAEVLRASGGGIVRSQSRVFDELGRLLQSVGAGSQVTAYGYDTNDNLLSITDPLTGISTQAFDALDRLVQQTDPLNGVTGYGYDAQGNLVSVTDPRGLATTYTYNGLGDVIQLSSPDTGTTVFTLDAAGNVISQVDARGVVTDFTYDALNRPLTRSYPAAPGENVAYGYDNTSAGNRGVGRLTAVTDRSGATSLVYDDYGNLAEDSRTIDGVVYTTQYSFDVAGNLLQMTYPDGRIVNYGRDALGRVTAITTQSDANAAPAVVASDITYEPFGPVAALTFGNGVVLTYSYDQDYRLTQITAGDGSNQVQDLTVSYDDADNITAITDLLDGARSQTFQYDGLYRLTQATGLYGTIDYGYDAVGNRTSRDIVDSLGTLNETYIYDAGSNRLLSLSDGTTTQSFGYSTSGQIIADDRGAGMGLGFVYDDSDRLVQLQSAGLPDTDYVHNAFGERVAKELLGSGDVTHFHYDQGGQLLGESDALGAFQRSYIYLDGMPIAQIEPLGGGTNQADVTQDNEDLGVLVQGDWTGASSLPGYQGTDYLAHPGADPVPTGGTLIDNSSPAFATTGLWPSSSALPGFEGTDYQSRSASGPFADSLEVDNLDAAVTVMGPWNISSRTLGGHSGPNYLWRTPNGVSSETIYLDNAGPEFSSTGYWFNSSWANGGAPYGGDLLFAAPNADPADTIIVDNTSPGFSPYGFWNTSTWSGGGRFDRDFHWIYASSASPASVLRDNMSAIGFTTVGPWTASGWSGGGAKYGSNFVEIDETVAPPGAEVVDNTSAGAAAVGTWTTASSSQDHEYGADYVYKLAGAGTASFTWTPTFAGSGDYEVLAFFPKGATLLNNAVYTVHHAGGATPVVVDQSTQGDRWVPLGTFTFDPGSNHRIVLSENGTDGNMVADAIQVRPVGTQPNKAVWTPDVPETKQYRIYAWWVQSAAFAPDATYTIHHAGGTTDVTVDQRGSNNQWNLLGTFTLAPGTDHRVELISEKASNRVVADGMQFFPVDGKPNTATWTPEFPVSQAYHVYAWWSQASGRALNATYTIHHSGGSSDAVVDQRVNGGKWNLLGTYDFAPGSNHRIDLSSFARGDAVADAVRLVPANPDPAAPRPTATWTPDIPATREYSVYAWWSEHDNRPPNATYVIHHAGGVSSVAVDQRALGGQWNLLGTYTFDPTSNPRIELSQTPTGYVIADAIRMIPTNGAPNSVTWNLNVPESEYYKLETRWVIRDGRATDAPYTVNHAAGSQTIPVDQTATWGGWVSLGSYLIPGDGSGSVQLADQADGVVQADAIRLTADIAPARSATWTYSPAENGDYRVFVRWPVGEGHATNVPYTIQHAGGSSVVTVSQAQRGGQWNELGVFPFDGGQDYAVTLSDDANGTVVADALYIVKVEDLADAVTWAPALPASGSYQVYAKWTSDETRATDALYRIVHSGGTAEVTVNQRVGGGLWHYLGNYAFDPQSSPMVTLAANDNGSVAADAVRFVGGPGGATDIAYLHSDHLGTPQAMTDATGQLLWWRDQTPFGQTVAEGGFSAIPLRFPGQYADAESGLAYNYFRDYDPALGRYIQSDPIGLGGGLNTYGYVGGNPLRYVDPTGEIAFLAPLVITPAVAAAEALGTATVFTGSAVGAAYLLHKLLGEDGETVSESAVQSGSSLAGGSCSADDGEDCEKLYAIDTATCNGIARIRGARAGAKCHASASERYSACLAGRPIPPLNTWNN